MHRASVQAADTTEQIGEITKLTSERIRKIHGQTTAGSEDYLASVIVPRVTSTRDITVLETAMQGLALDKRHPVALELAATASSRTFLLRATSAMSLKHLADQVQARYPQAIIRWVGEPDDPFVLRDGETVSAVELRAGAAAYLPLRALRERELLQEGADPLLGILGVFNHLPPHLRVVSQLALIPASPTWSSLYRRKSVEHPLELERLRARRELGSGQASAPSTFRLVAMGVLVALLLVWWRVTRQLDGLIPYWLLQVGVSVLHGKAPLLSSAHLRMLEIGGIIAFVALFCLAFVVLQIRNRLGATLMYDMRLVDEKTARSAYRVRLRLFVFSTEVETMPAHDVLPSEVFLQRFSPQLFIRSSLRDTYQGWREAAQRNRHRRQEQRNVLDHLVAAYRQYHTAAGGYFSLCRLSQAKGRRLLTYHQGWLPFRHSGWTGDVRRSTHLLSVADIASLWHLPQAQDLFDLPFVERARARTALAPPELTRGNGWKIGASSHAGHCVPVFLPEECLRHNLLAVASTGKGKSTLFQHLAQAVCTLRTNCESIGAPGLAFMLIQQDPYHGPDRQYTLLDVVPLLRRASFRHAVLEQVRDSLLLDWWQHYYEPMDAHQQREVTSSVITKLSKFSSSRVARRILGQPRSTIDLREVVHSGQHLLVSTASGVVGADLSELIGIVLLGLFEAALAEQAKQPPEQRRRYLVLIDEFQVYRGANYQGMLAELRKYGGSFALATQSLAYLDRLDRTLRATVLANIDHLFAFHMAGEDARLLHELEGITEEDITNLDDFQCYVKLSLHGHRLPVFSLNLDAPTLPDEDLARLVRLRSQERNGRPVGAVDHLIGQIQARQKSATPAIHRASHGKEAEEAVTGKDSSREEVDRSRRHKKRGGSNHNQHKEGVAPAYMHLMYRKEDERTSSREQEDEEQDSVDA